LARTTLAELPPEIEVIKLSTTLDWPVGTIDLLVASMQLAGNRARDVGIDPGRPGVQPFGRRLYHLSPRQMVPSVPSGPVARKLAAVGASERDEVLGGLYSDSMYSWLEATRATQLGGVVLDYDGTCCATSERFETLGEKVRAALTRLLAGGLLIGFASGRGKSLYRELRSWVPAELWDRVELALYNGGVRLTLAEDLPEDCSLRPILADAAERIGDSFLTNIVKMDVRPSQLGIELLPGSRIRGDVVAALVTELLCQAPALTVKVVSSAHSVDVIPADSSKAAIVAEMAERSSSGILSVGDQGQLGGNDFELLACTQTSLSVDQCSADPTRCWNLSRANRPGPLALVDYLAAIKISKSGADFRWSL
jgi:hypothetical protein